MKVAELEGIALDRWAAKVAGVFLWDEGTWYQHIAGGRVIDGNPDRWAPSERWEQGGPLIEQWQIGLEPSDSPVRWLAEMVHPAREDGVQRSACTGPTALIAAMRVLVASKFGDEVPDL